MTRGGSLQEEHRSKSGRQRFPSGARGNGISHAGKLPGAPVKLEALARRYHCADLRSLDDQRHKLRISKYRPSNEMPYMRMKLMFMAIQACKEDEGHA